MSKDKQAWLQARRYTPEMLSLARLALDDVRSGRTVTQAVQRHPLPGGGYLGKHVLVAAYRHLVESGAWSEDPVFLERIRMKPVRTLSGVTTVTVLTKPFPCPGACIFCPDDARMPKSYLPNEPGARRALDHAFDPFDQVSARIQALTAVGHPTDKIELLILGGSWSAYPRDYQEWFVRRCFEAMNGALSTGLEDAHMQNESAPHRNVGLVVETRPDHINANVLAWLRTLGVTKVQMGAQSLDDRILALNRRGHTLAETHRAAELLRLAGFKIVLHWMPNLLGASPDSDRQDFARLWDGLCPDEIKIYPTQLLENTDLYRTWQQGEYQPYTTDQLVDLIADIKPSIPRYCRVNRIIRDIPSTEVVAGNKRTSLRQDVQKEMLRRGTRCQCIRCREVRKQIIQSDDLRLEDIVYMAQGTEEHFLSFVTPDDQLAGFLRLSLPQSDAVAQLEMEDLRSAALIREVHIYGQSLPVGMDRAGVAQHSGLGTRLIHHAEQLVLQRGYSRLAVIAAIGTRLYYLGRGFERGQLYLCKPLA